MPGIEPRQREAAGEGRIRQGRKVEIGVSLQKELEQVLQHDISPLSLASYTWLIPCVC